MTMPSDPYIELQVPRGSKLNTVIRKACHIATTLSVDVRFKAYNDQWKKESFHFRPGIDPEEAIAAYAQATTTES